MELRSRQTLSSSSDEHDDEMAISTGAILGICLCIGIPLLIVALFCLYAKCSKRGQVSPSLGEERANRTESPKPVFVLYTRPPPYVNDGPPPTYEESVALPSGSQGDDTAAGSADLSLPGRTPVISEQEVTASRDRTRGSRTDTSVQVLHTRMEASM